MHLKPPQSGVQTGVHIAPPLNGNAPPFTPGQPWPPQVTSDQKTIEPEELSKKGIIQPPTAQSMLTDYRKEEITPDLLRIICSKINENTGNFESGFSGFNSNSEDEQANKNLKALVQFLFLVNKKTPHSDQKKPPSLTRSPTQNHLQP